MVMRKTVVVGDKTTTGGVILPNANSTFSLGNAGYKAALIGGPVQCPACKRDGIIAKAGGPRRMKFMGEVALENDIVLCGCSTPPKVIATLHHTSMYEDEEASAVLTAPAASSSARQAPLMSAASLHDGVYRPDGSLHFTQVAQEAGHTSLVDLVGFSFIGRASNSLTRDQLNRIVAYSQFVDETRIFDGYTSGVRVMLDVGEPSAVVQVAETYERAIHALNGNTVFDNSKAYLDFINAHKDDLASIGLGMHGLVDSVFHARYGAEKPTMEGLMNARTYPAPVGHGIISMVGGVFGFKGVEPDYLTTFKVEAARDLLLQAFKVVSGVNGSDFLISYSLTQNWLNDALTNAESTGLSGRSFDLNFMAVVAAMLPNGAEFSPELNHLPDPLLGQGNLRVNPITPDTTLAETRNYLTHTPLRGENPQSFLLPAINAAIALSNFFIRSGRIPGPLLNTQQFGIDQKYVRKQ